MDVSAPSSSPFRAPGAEEARAARAAQEFEAMLAAQFLKPIFQSVKTPALFGGGKGEDAFTSLLHEEFAKAISARGGFGLADAVKRELISLQAAQSPPGREE
jgi:Rod binding domain-containing protein